MSLVHGESFDAWAANVELARKNSNRQQLLAGAADDQKVAVSYMVAWFEETSRPDRNLATLGILASTASDLLRRHDLKVAAANGNRFARLHLWVSDRLPRGEF